MEQDRKTSNEKAITSILLMARNLLADNNEDAAG
jgi:hypothetical protein